MLKGVPKGWNLRVRDILTYKGAGSLFPLGSIALMPGTAAPAFMHLDVNTETGKVEGLF